MWCLAFCKTPAGDAWKLFDESLVFSFLVSSQWPCGLLLMFGNATHGVSQQFAVLATWPLEEMNATADISPPTVHFFQQNITPDVISSARRLS